MSTLCETGTSPPQPELIFLHPSDELYGADRVLLNMLSALPDDNKCEVWLPRDLAHPPEALSLCTALVERGVRARHLDLPIVRRAYRNPRGIVGLIARSWALVRELRKASPTAVYCTTSAAILGAPLARLAKVPHIIGHIQEVWSTADATVLRLPALACNTILATSDATAAALPESLRQRAVVLPNGTTEATSLVPLEHRSGPLTFLVASRWNARKGHATLISAWEMANAPGRLIILGGPPLTGDFVDVHELVERSVRRDSVSVLGEVADASKFYNQADVVVIPSDQPEGFGLVAIEAFSHGRPVIASATGGLTGVVSNGVNGWTFPVGDANALARILAGLSRNGIVEAGEQARQTFEREFTAERFASDWRRLVLEGHAKNATSGNC